MTTPDNPFERFKREAIGATEMLEQWQEATAYEPLPAATQTHIAEVIAAARTWAPTKYDACPFCDGELFAKDGVNYCSSCGEACGMAVGE